MKRHFILHPSAFILLFYATATISISAPAATTAVAGQLGFDEPEDLARVGPAVAAEPGEHGGDDVVGRVDARLVARLRRAGGGTVGVGVGYEPVARGLRTEPGEVGDPGLVDEGS